jgi:hypothetical protein
MGMMTGDDLAAAYASLDVFVMPSVRLFLFYFRYFRD